MLKWMQFTDMFTDIIGHTGGAVIAIVIIVSAMLMVFLTFCHS